MRGWGGRSICALEDTAPRREKGRERLNNVVKVFLLSLVHAASFWSLVDAESCELPPQNPPPEEDERHKRGMTTTQPKCYR